MDWVVSFGGIVGFLLIGRKIWWAWYVNLGCQVLWVIFALAIRQYGLLVGVVFYTAAFGWNAYTWTRDHRDHVLIDHNHMTPEACGSWCPAYDLD